LSYAVRKQTDKQTNGSENNTPPKVAEVNASQPINKSINLSTHKVSFPATYRPLVQSILKRMQSAKITKKKERFIRYR